MLGRGSLVLARLRFSRALAVHATCKHVRATTLVVASYHTCAPHVLKPKTWHAVSGRVGRLIPNYSTSQTAVAERSKAPLQPGLYLVGTPIGNLEDLTVRALRVLQTATVVLAEDTRHSRKLLNHYKIDAHLHSFHQHNEYSKQDRVGAANRPALIWTGSAGLSWSRQTVSGVSHILVGAGPTVTRSICGIDQ